MRFVAFALFLTVTGCIGSHEPEVEIEGYVPLPFAEVGRGRQASVDTVHHRAILHAAAWAAYQGSLRPLRAFTPVDFGAEMLLVAALPVASGGYDLRFEEIEDTGDILVARYRLYLPGDDCRSTVGAGNVFQVVRTVRSEKPVKFERTDELVPCTEP